MKNLCFLLLLFCTNSLYAQWQIENSNIIGGNGDEDFNDVIATETGYIAVGFTTSSNNGDIAGDSNGFSDYWIVNFDFEGNIIWEKNYGGLGNDIANSIEVADLDNFWIFGTIDSSGTQINNYLGKIDTWGIKINQDGELLNQVTFGGSNDDIVKNIAKNEQGNLYLVGETDSTDGDVISNFEQKNAWLLVINEAGELLNSATFGGNKKDGFTAIDFSLEENKFYIGGYTNSDDGDITTPTQLTDTWLLAINNGETNIAGQNIWGGSSSEIIIDITVLENGNIAFTGETSSPDISNFQGTFDIIAGVYQNNGTLLWAKAFGGSAADSPLKIVENAQNDLAVLAYSNSLGGDIGVGYQAFNVWLAEINADNGNIIKSQILGGNRWDFGSALVPLANNGYFILCNTDSFDGDVQDNGSGKKLAQDGNHDIWIAKLKPITTSSNFIKAGALFSVYPNPADEYLFVDSEWQNIETMSLYNSLGQVVFQTNNFQQIINIQHLAKGTYLLKIVSKDAVFLEKVVIFR